MQEKQSTSNTYTVQDVPILPVSPAPPVSPHAEQVFNSSTVAVEGSQPHGLVCISEMIVCEQCQ